MFLSYSNRAKILALLLVISFNNNCGAMNSGVDIEKKWNECYMDVLKQHGNPVLTNGIWDEIKRIFWNKINSMEGEKRKKYMERQVDQVKELLKEPMENVSSLNSVYLIGQRKHFMNIFERALSGHVTCSSNFVYSIVQMIKNETEKMRNKTPQELLDEYWIPEFGIPDLHGRNQSESAIREFEEKHKIFEVFGRPKNCNAFYDEDPNVNAKRRAAYMFPNTDPWLSKKTGIFPEDSILKSHELGDKLEYSKKDKSEYSICLSILHDNFHDVVLDKKIDKLIFKHGKLKYCSGDRSQNLSLNELDKEKVSNNNKIFDIIAKRSDRASYILSGRDDLDLINFGILLISRVLESLINQAFVLSGLNYSDFDYIEITKFGYNPEIKVFKNGKQVVLESDLYEKVCKKLESIYILKKCFTT